MTHESNDLDATDVHLTVLHIPHASRTIPREARADILLGDADLERALTWMTDAYTDETSHGGPLRAAPGPQLREAMLAKYYRPHHDALTRQVERALDRWNRCLVIDCHSFPSKPLPYEPNRSAERPDICLGTDEFHTPESLVAAYEASFRREGFTLTRNRPFAGALVPSLHFRRDPRVTAVMIEINRKLYMDEDSGARAEQFEAFARRLRCIIEEWIGAGTGGNVSG